MSRFNRWIAATAIILVACSRTPIAKKVVIDVNGQTMDASQFAEELAFQLRELDALNAKDPESLKRTKEKIVNDFIVQALSAQWAKDNNVILKAEDIDAEIKKIRDGYPDDLTFQQGLADQGMSYRSWRSRLEKSLLQKLVIQKISENLPKPPEADVLSYYQGHKADFMEKETVQIRQIVLPTENDAEAIEQQLAHGRSLSSLIPKYSAQPPGPNNPSVLWVKKGEEPLFDSAFKFKAGRRSPIMKSEFGYHIFEVLAHKVPKLKPLADVKANIVRILMEKTEQSAYLSWLDIQVRKARVFKDQALIDNLRVETKNGLRPASKEPDGRNGRKDLNMKALFALPLLGFLCLPVNAGEIDRIVAIVNDQIITASDAEGFRKNLNGGGMVDDALLQMVDAKKIASDRDALLDFMINEKLLDSEVKKKGLEVTIERVEQEIRDLITKRNITRDQLKEVLQDRGVSMAQYQDYIKTSLERHALIEKEVSSKIRVSDEEVASYYLAQHASANNQVYEYTIAHIVVIPHNGNEEKAHQKAEAAYGALKQGEGFESVAEKYSEDPSFSKGGLLGSFTESEMKSDIVDAVKKLQVGDFSTVVRTPRGFSIYKLISRTVVADPKMESEKEEIRNKLFGDAFKKQFQAWLQEERDDAFVKINGWS